MGNGPRHRRLTGLSHVASVAVHHGVSPFLNYPRQNTDTEMSVPGCTDFTMVPRQMPGRTIMDDARDAFLLELASFQLSLKKSLMVCEAETRQVEEYQRERERIGVFPSPCPGNPFLSDRVTSK